jgi:hypothetical protein
MLLNEGADDWRRDDRHGGPEERPFQAGAKAVTGCLMRWLVHVEPWRLETAPLFQ